MKIHVDHPLKDDFGNPITGMEVYQCEKCGHIVRAGEDLTVGKIIYMALHSPKAEEKNKDKLYERHLLAQRIIQGGKAKTVELDDPDELSLILECIFQTYSPLIYGVMKDMLKVKEEPKKGKGSKK